MALRPIKFVKLAIVVASIAGIVGVFNLGLPRRSGAEKFAFLAVAGVGVGLYMGADAYDQRERRRNVLAWLASIGFAEDEPSAHTLGVHYTPQKKHHSFAMKLFAQAQWRGRGARVAEYEFQTGHGKGRRTWRYCYAAIECPVDWPPIEVFGVPRGFTALMPERAYRRGIKLGDPSFSKRWRVTSPELAAAEALLTPELRSWLASGSWRERWCISGGWLSCTRLGVCDDRGTERLLARVAVFLSKCGEAAVAS